MAHDRDADGVPDADGLCTTYDAIHMVGAATYVACLTVGACEAMADFAVLLDSTEVHDTWVAAAAKARATAESLLWVPDPGYYRLDTAGPFSSALLADALCGQRYPARDGLPDVLDTGRMGSHLWQAFQRNVLGFAGGQLGAVNAVTVPGGPIDSFQGRGVWPGGTYFTAASMYSVGKALDRDDLMDAAVTTGYGVYRTTYLDARSAFWFDTPALWFAGAPMRYRAAAYERARAAWELLVAIKDPFPPQWSPR